MRRFYISSKPIPGEQIRISGQEARHITSVLRLTGGATVECFDNSGTIYTAVLEQTNKHEVLARIQHIRIDTRQEAAPLTLAQALLKGKKMDFLIQKSTELGVDTFLPLTTRYCENKGQRQRQSERWQKIMIEACKQSHRTRPMNILEVTPLELADFSTYTNRLVAWEEDTSHPPRNLLTQNPGSNCLIIGPEGGIQAEEINLLIGQGFTSFSLGKATLRAETAAIVATTLVQYLSGNLYPPHGKE